MPVTVAEIARTLRERSAADRRRAETRARGLSERLTLVAADLKERGATNVWLFGSLAEGRPTLESDVDIAVEGLPADRCFDALTTASELLGTRVDLVSLERAPTSLRQRVLETGVRL